MDSLRGVGSLVGRLLMAIIFVLGGILKLTHPVMTAAMMEKVGGMHTLVLPLAVIAALIELVGGILLLIGFQSRIVAAVLFLYLIPVTILFHVLPGGQLNQIQMMKNLAIMGGMLVIASNGGGGLSVDSARSSA
jgi:putative oxidoreductase